MPATSYTSSSVFIFSTERCCFAVGRERPVKMLSQSFKVTFYWDRLNLKVSHLHVCMCMCAAFIPYQTCVYMHTVNVFLCQRQQAAPCYEAKAQTA